MTGSPAGPEEPDFRTRRTSTTSVAFTSGPTPAGLHRPCRLREFSSEVLAVAAGLSRGTIETVLAKSDLQPGAEALLRGVRIARTGRPGVIREAWQSVNHGCHKSAEHRY